ncbi:MAG: hypothetical protein L6405_02215 [Actinomycetia bacterium]|nr:hypothetical protein [Actinomycetes bacterium]
MRKVKKNTQEPKERIFCSENLLAIYEELRSYVLEGICTFSRPPGLDLFLKKGFLKWMQVQSEGRDYHKPVRGPGIKVKKQGFMPQELESEITMLLANMILEERSSNVSV